MRFIDPLIKHYSDYLYQGAASKLQSFLKGSIKNFENFPEATQALREFQGDMKLSICLHIILS